MKDRTRRGVGRALASVVGILAALLVVALIVNPFVSVSVGRRAVLFSLQGGTQSRQLGEGLHLIVPFVQRAVYYDVRSQTYTMSGSAVEGSNHGDGALSALTSDGQTVQVEISIRFHPDPDHVWRLHQRVGPDYMNKIIRPEVRSKTRVVIAEYPVDDVYSRNRMQVQSKIGDLLKASLHQNDLIVDDVLVRDIQFSPAYAAAIEQKQIAQQNAQRMQYVLLKAALDKKQKILEAQGDARSIQLRGAAVADGARVIQYEYLKKIAPNVKTIITDGKSIPVLSSGGK